MRSWTNVVRIVSACALALACAACGPGREESPASGERPASTGPGSGAAPAASNSPVEKLRIPLAVWPDGKVKTQVVAARAQMPEEGGDVVASQIRIEMYGQDGEQENLVMAQDCRYNRERGVATSDSKVQVERDGVFMTGKGFEWNASNETVRINDDVKVVLRRKIGFDIAGPRRNEGGAAE